ncbi:Fic family protein [uncultured Enterovirga sp.]|uniref:Fic family protein n=1 Tax=uncultured Enterovirga sp. TaxID=2026352 RepID=UPI0035CA3B68
MTDPVREERHSQALEPEIITDPHAKAEAEGRNGLRQYDLAVQFVFESVERQSFRLRPSMVLSLHREALRGISSYAGNFRPGDVEIRGSKHEPVGAHLVAALVEDMCDEVNERWIDATAIQLAAYVMWRLNWIHPFADGNGRTSRATSFVVLSAKLGGVLPGTPTFPELIVSHRISYEDALDAADDAWKRQVLDLSKMEALLESLLAQQLARVFETAGGRA